MGKALDVLMIGNSFSICVGKFLPQMVRCFSGNKIKLTSCFIGGCSLETHWNNFCEAEKNPDFAPYRITIWDSTTLKKPQFKGSVNDRLKSEKYDIVTIQQASRYSVDYAAFQPFADELIKQVKKYQPQAEIIIQQTWSYRADAPFLRENGIDNSTMYAKLEAAYRQLAEDYGFRMIPTGYAYAEDLGKTYTTDQFKEMLLTSVYDINADLAKYAKYSTAGDVVPLQPYYRQMGTGAVDAYRALSAVRGMICVPAVAGKETVVSIKSLVADGQTSFKMLEEIIIPDDVQRSHFPLSAT